MSTTSPLVRLCPLQPSELPAHPLLTSTDSESTPRPALLPFALSLLDQGNAVLDPTYFNIQFKSHSHKPSPPSNTNVEALTCTIPSADLSGDVTWNNNNNISGGTGEGVIGRTRPRDIPTEHWFARRSYHANISSKINSATASWEEFVFGLRDNHSRNEAEFTPTLYDARHILDWNDALAEATDDGKYVEGPNKHSYTKLTLAVYEMCHEIPFPLQPRCFPVLVATASTSDTRFVAVTVPVNLSSFDGAFYSNGKNRIEGEEALRRKQVVLGGYTAVESVALIERDGEDNTTLSSTGGVGDGNQSIAAPQKKKEQVVEWVMGTASDAKGNLPMVIQRASMPGAVVKDVGFFLNWIHTVDDAVVKGEKPQVFTKDLSHQTASSSTSDGLQTRRSRGLSAASREVLSSARSSIEKATSLTPPTSSLN